MDRVDRKLHLLMAEKDRAQHHVFRQLIGFGLDHQNRALGPGHHQIQGRILQLRGGRIHDQLAVHVSDASRPDRSFERDARQRQRSRGADQRRNIGVDFRIDRHHVQDHLHFVVEAVGEQRANRPINQARGQHLFFRRTPLTFEEAAWDAPGRIRLLDIVDRQREKVLPGASLAGRHDRGQHHRIVHRNQHAAVGLACDFPRLELHRVRPELKRLGHFLEHLVFLSCPAKDTPMRAAIRPGDWLSTRVIRRPVRAATAAYLRRPKLSIRPL